MSVKETTEEEIAVIEMRADGERPLSYFVLRWRKMARSSLEKKKRARLGNGWVLWQNEMCLVRHREER